jgi:hypothetical protein
MAEEVYMVAFNIKDKGSSYGNISFSKKGAGSEASFPPATQETNSLQSADGLTDRVGTADLVEVTAGSAAEAVEVVRLNFPNCSGKMRAVVSPNTNFKSVTP